MTGRGKQWQDKGPDTKRDKGKTNPKGIKQVPLPTHQGKGIPEGQQNGTTKTKKPKEQNKTNHTEEKLSAHGTQKEITTKPLTEKITEKQRKDTDNKKSPVQGTKVQTCTGRTKTSEQSAEEIMMTQTETPKDTNQNPPKTTKGKTRGGKAKLHAEFTEETGKTQTPKDTKTKPEITTKASIPTTNAKRCPDRAQTPMMPQDTLKDAACATRDKYEDNAGVDSILYKTVEKIKISKSKRSDAAKIVNEIIKKITTHLKSKTESFKEVMELRTGSYYENLKIANADEFDVMIAIPVGRVNIEPFGDDGAFYSVTLKRGNSPLKKFQEEDTLSASKLLAEFRAEVKKSVKEFTEWEVTKKKKGCPAVTLIREVPLPISLDVVLSLMVEKSSWPPFTMEGFKIESWLGTKVKQEYKRQPFYLVPKYEGWGTVVKDGVLTKDVWRISFSHIEKAIMRSHGSQKTCCEKGGARCCRKDCVKLLKHLLSLLKEQNSSFEKFCSYYAKTTFFHACCSRNEDTDWRASRLGHCFQLLLQDFRGHLESGVLKNFFIPNQNLLSGLEQKKCKELAQCMKEECDKGFPIFKSYLARDRI